MLNEDQQMLTLCVCNTLENRENHKRYWSKTCIKTKSAVKKDRDCIYVGALQQLLRWSVFFHEGCTIIMYFLPSFLSGMRVHSVQTVLSRTTLSLLRKSQYGWLFDVPRTL